MLITANVDHPSQTLTLSKGFWPKKAGCSMPCLSLNWGPENHTLFNGTYPFRPNKGVHPPHPLPPPEDVTFVWLWVLYVVVTINRWRLFSSFLSCCFHLFLVLKITIRWYGRGRGIWKLPPRAVSFWSKYSVMKRKAFHWKKQFL